jgi:CheY-like chemotaxis protein
MSRVALIHWNAAEAAERAARLRQAGHRAEVPDGQSGAAIRALRESPPDAFVIDLSRIPSQGIAVATLVRQQKATRPVPIVFVDGDRERVARARQMLPDAEYTTWDKIREALERALSNPPENPVVPGTMDGYSGTPLAKKLGIRAGASVLLLGAPTGFERQLGTLPDGVKLGKRAQGKGNLILLFAASQADLRRRFPAARRAMADRASMWIAWPKQASGVAADLREPHVRAFGLEAGLVDYKICSIDATWSGLLFTQRKKAK